MPFETLKEATKHKKAPQEGDYWRVNFSRVQWKLRKLYYAQHAYFDEHGCFTTDLNMLTQGKKLGVDVGIEVTKSNFEMYCKTAHGNHEIAILGDGKIIIR